MKILLLMRHAKSSWGNESLPDFDRPLNERGRRDALRIGRELTNRGAVPDVIITSTAVRAMETTSRLREAFDCACMPHSVIAVQPEPELYGAPPDRILDIVNQIPDDCCTVLIVGHNPGMQYLVTELTDEWIPEGMKTATVARISNEVECWSQVKESGGTLEWLLYPGQLGNE